MILLTSDGLSSDALLAVVDQEVNKNNYKTAAIVVTADKRFKKKSKSAQILREQLELFSVRSILFDFGNDDQALLDDIDIIVFDGGNPFYLLLKLKEFEMETKLNEYASQNKFIIGVSGGSLALQESLGLIDVFALDMNMRHGGDLKGMGLTDIEMLPHKSRYEVNFKNFKERYEKYRNEHKTQIYLLEDGEGLLISDTIVLIENKK